SGLWARSTVASKPPTRFSASTSTPTLPGPSSADIVAPSMEYAVFTSGSVHLCSVVNSSSGASASSGGVGVGTRKPKYGRGGGSGDGGGADEVLCPGLLVPDDQPRLAGDGDLARRRADRRAGLGVARCERQGRQGDGQGGKERSAHEIPPPGRGAGGRSTRRP